MIIHPLPWTSFPNPQIHIIHRIGHYISHISIKTYTVIYEHDFYVVEKSQQNVFELDIDKIISVHPTDQFLYVIQWCGMVSGDSVQLDWFQKNPTKHMSWCYIFFHLDEAVLNHTIHKSIGLGPAKWGKLWILLILMPICNRSYPWVSLYITPNIIFSPQHGYHNGGVYYRTQCFLHI